MDTKAQSGVYPFHAETNSVEGDGLRSTSGWTRRHPSPPSDRQRTNPGVVPVLFCFCSAIVVLTMTSSLVFHLSGVQTELNALRQRLERLETRLEEMGRGEMEDTARSKDESFQEYHRNWGFLSQVLNSSDLVRPSLKEGLESSTELGPREGRRRSQRSPRSPRSPRSVVSTQTPKRNERKKTEKNKKDSKSPVEKISAVHFQPKNSSSRTITTKRDSPVLDFWEAAKWSKPPTKSFYHIRDGVVTILEDGIYFIYVQLVFHDLSGRWSFSININDRQELKCINSEHISSETTFHPTNHGVYQHCFSSRLFHVRRLEQVTVRCLYEQRQILASPEFTFWGIMKMS